MGVQTVDQFSDDDEDMLRVINLVTCGVSIVSSTFIVVSAILTGLMRNSRLTGLRLVFMLSLTDIFYSIAYFIGDPDGGSVECYVQAVMGQFFGIASVGWPLAIATFLWCTFILDWPEDEGPRFFWISNAVIWGFSGLMAAIPLNHYDTAGGWCWIDQDGYGDAMRFGTFYIIIWLVVLAIVAFYFSLIRHLHAVALLPEEKERCCYQLRSVTAILIKGDPSQADTHTIDQVYLARMIRYMRRQCLFPVVLIVCWIVPTINRIHDLVSDDPTLWLAATALATSNLTGLLNAIVYGFIQTAWRDEMKRCCCGVDEEEDSQSPRKTVDPELEDGQDVDDQLADAFGGDSSDEDPVVNMEINPTSAKTDAEKRPSKVMDRAVTL